MRRLLLLALCVLLLSGCTGESTPARPAPAALQPSTAQPHTPFGAVRAASALVRLLNSRSVYSADARSSLLTQYSAPSLEPDVSSVDAGYARAAAVFGLDHRASSPSGQLVAQSAVLTATVREYRPERAVVVLWTVGVLGVAGEGSAHPVTAHWSTEEIAVRWSDDRWLWDGLTHHDGPAPVADPQVPATPRDLVTAAGWRVDG